MKQGRAKAEQLQFLRFCAFLLIFLWHAEPWVPTWAPHGNGAANAVSFFFILSGLVAGYSSYSQTVYFSFATMAKYMWKKLRKVYPLYFITTIFTISYSGIPIYIATYDLVNLKEAMLQLAANLLLIQSWFPRNYFAFNGVGWFLSSIIFLYCLKIPLTAGMTKLSKSVRYWQIILGAVFILTAFMTVLYCYIMRGLNTEFWTYVFPPSRIGEYICGMCLGYIVHSLLDKIPSSVLFKVLFSLAEIISLTIWIYDLYIPTKSWSFRIVHWLFPNFLILGVFTFGKGIISDLFRKKFFKQMGNISFECFLLHQIVIHQYSVNINFWERISSIGNWFSIGFCLLMTIMLAEYIAKCYQNE